MERVQNGVHPAATVTQTRLFSLIYNLISSLSQRSHTTRVGPAFSFVAPLHSRFMSLYLLYSLLLRLLGLFRPSLALNRGTSERYRAARETHPGRSLFPRRCNRLTFLQSAFSGSLFSPGSPALSRDETTYRRISNADVPLSIVCATRIRASTMSRARAYKVNFLQEIKKSPARILCRDPLFAEQALSISITPNPSDVMYTRTHTHTVKSTSSPPLCQLFVEFPAKPAE